MADFVVLGEALIDLFGEPGQPLGLGSRFVAKPGGAPANVAAALGKLGASVAFVGKVGEDAFGHTLRRALQDFGVDVRHMTATPGLPTMTAVVSLPASGEPEFVLYHGANRSLGVKDLPADEIRAAKALIFGSVTLAVESREAAMAAAAIARAAGRDVIFDVNFRPALWRDFGDARAAIEAAIDLASIVKLNEAEMTFLFGNGAPPDGLRRLNDRGVQFCCQTMGAGGARFCSPTASGHVPAFAVPVLDATGCGDAFIAGLATRLLAGTEPLAMRDHSELSAAVRYANACGAIVATQLGAMEAELTPSSVEAVLTKTRSLG